MTKTLSCALAAVGALLTTTAASAHIGVSGTAFANTNWEGTFLVGHGCGTSDTYSVKIEIPAGVTAVRGIDGSLGRAVPEKVGDNVVSITWTKPVADVLASDLNYYKLPLRARLPNTPFATLYFKAYQVCRDAQGNITTTDWIGTDAPPVPGAPPLEPAPAVTVLPPRAPGWNKYTVPSKITALSIFNDAEIVWAGDAAYSANQAYKDLIATEPNTTALTEIAANSVIWVKY